MVDLFIDMFPVLHIWGKGQKGQLSYQLWLCGHRKCDSGHSNKLDI